MTEGRSLSQSFRPRARVLQLLGKDTARGIHCFPQVRSSTPSMREANRLTDCPEWSGASPPRKSKRQVHSTTSVRPPEAATISCLRGGQATDHESFFRL